MLHPVLSFKKATVAGPAALMLLDIAAYTVKLMVGAASVLKFVVRILCQTRPFPEKLVGAFTGEVSVPTIAANARQFEPTW
jgi:hypothetical protein